MSREDAMVTVVHVTTVPLALWAFFGGQFQFMRGRGIKSVAITSPGEHLDKVIQRDGIDVHTVPMQRRISPLADLLALARLCWVIRKVRPDIVHSHTPKAGVLGMIAAWLM